MHLSREGWGGGGHFCFDATETTYLSASLRFIEQDHNNASRLIYTDGNGRECGKSDFSYSEFRDATISNETVDDDSNVKCGIRFDAGVCPTSATFHFQSRYQPIPIHARSPPKKSRAKQTKLPLKLHIRSYFFHFE